MRYAIYHVPSMDEPLGAFGAGVLGYDMVSGRAVSRLDPVAVPALDWAALTEGPRRYGFHATLRAPFRLARGQAEAALVDRVARFAAHEPAVHLGPLAVSAGRRYVTLRPRDAAPGLAPFERRLLEAVAPLAALPDAAELARRAAVGLTPRQTELLAIWGYPHVLDEFRFHMTLAGPVSEPGLLEAAGAALTAAFPLRGVPQIIDRIAIAVEPSPGAPFHVMGQFQLGGGTT